MSNVAGRVVDYYDDPQFFKTAEAAALVEAGKIVDALDAAKLPDSAFALKLAGRRMHRYFPVHTKEAAWLSAHYWEEASFLSDKAREVAAQNLKVAFDQFGLAETKALAAVEKRASTANLVIDTPAPDAAAPELTKTADVVMSAIDTFMAREARMDPDRRCLLASSIVKEASAAGLLGSVPRRVMDYAVKSQVSPWITTKLAERRAVVTANAGDIGAFDHLAQRIRKTASVEKTLELLDRVDRAFDLAKYYGTKVADPFLSVFGGVKIAAALGNTWGDETDPKLHALRSIAYEENAVRQLFGDDYARKFQRNPIDCYNKSTGKVKQLLDAMISELTDASLRGKTVADVKEIDKPWTGSGQGGNEIKSIGPRPAVSR